MIRYWYNSSVWDDLLIFRAVVGEHSFTRAADRLGMAQSSVSRRVRSLERRLGVVLLERTTRRVVVTPAGHAVLDAVGQMDAVWQRTCDNLKPDPDLSTASTSRTKVTVFDLRPRQIQRFLQSTSPGHRWEMSVVGDVFTGVERLSPDRPEVFVGYRLPYWPWPDLTDLRSTVMIREPLWVTLPATHPLAAAPSVSLRHLADMPWVARPDAYDVAHLEAVCRNHGGFTPRIAHQVADFSRINEMIAVGSCAGLTSPCLSHEDSVVIRPLTERVYGEVVLVWAPPAVPQTRIELVAMALRAWYAALAQERNPAWWRDICEGEQPSPFAPQGIPA